MNSRKTGLTRNLTALSSFFCHLRLYIDVRNMCNHGAARWLLGLANL